MSVEVNREIAEALGYTAKELPHKEKGGTYWILVNPEGKCIYSFGSGGTENEQWVWRRGLPDFAGDLNAALMLAAAVPVNLISAPVTRWGACNAIWRAEIAWKPSGVAYHDIAATALCMAWLEWKRKGSVT